MYKERVNDGETLYPHELILKHSSLIKQFALIVTILAIAVSMRDTYTISMVIIGISALSIIVSLIVLGSIEEEMEKK